MMLKNIIIMTLLSVSINVFPQSKQKSIDDFIANPAFNHASIGICVKDFNGEEIISYNSDKSFTPASVLKLITTSTAFETLGSNYTYKTTLAKKDDHLYIKGSGDPTLGTKHLGNEQKAFLGVWSDEIKKAFPGTKEIEITVVDNCFGYEGIPPRWIRQDMGNYYAAATYGISVFDNTYLLYFNTMRQDTCPVITKAEPINPDDFTFLNMLTLNLSGKDYGFINGEPFSYERTLVGSIPAGRKSFIMKGDLPDPGLFLGKSVSDAILEKGIITKSLETSRKYYLNDRYKKEKTSFDGEVFYTHESFPLSDIAKNINHRSNNHYAQYLLQTLGRKRNSDIYSSSTEEGITFIKNYWQKQGLDTKALFMYDGCGLAPSNAVSPEFLCDLLIYMQTKSKNSKEFLNTLPQAGKDGTVRNLLRGTRLVGKIYAKSGSIANVRCFAGYYINGEKKYAFTIMVNNFNCTSAQTTKSIEKLMLGIF